MWVRGSVREEVSEERCEGGGERGLKGGVRGARGGVKRGCEGRG